MSQDENENTDQSVGLVPNKETCPIFAKLVISWHVVEKLLRKVKPNLHLKKIDIPDAVKVPTELVEEYYRKVLDYETEGVHLLKSTGICFCELFFQDECPLLLKQNLEMESDVHSSQLEDLSLQTYERTGKRERVNKSDSLFHSLGAQGLPPILCLIFSNLIERENTMERYNSMVDLEEDLRMVIDDPARFAAHVFTFKGHLEIPSNRLYGRDQIVCDLRQRCKEAFNPRYQSDVFLISGYSGTGKSSLVWNIEPYFTQLGGFFISGTYTASKILCLVAVLL